MTAARPSARALERRIAQAERQRDFARAAGWHAVADLYARLAADLRAVGAGR